MVHGRRFNPAGGLDLRSPERLALLEVDSVIELTLQGAAAHTLLDVGTGVGVFAGHFAGRGVKVQGVDVSPGMLASARGFLPQLPFVAAPAEALPYCAESFDIVFLGLVLHETDDTLRALSEARRVAKRRVAVFEWRDEEQDFGPPRAHRLSEERIAEIANEAGFAGMETVPLRDLVLYRLEIKG